MPDEREDELRTRLERVKATIAAAASRAGRRETDVTLVVVTKTWPVDDIARLARAGVRDVGENRHQDAEPKAHALHELGLRWHFVGQLQSNKAARIAAYADVVHSVDSERVANRLAKGADSAGRTIDCFVQVSLDDPDEPGAGETTARGGVVPDQAIRLAEIVRDAEALRLVGVMGVAPLRGDARAAYQRLRRASDLIRSIAPDATAISAGMSEDFEIAIEEGATHVRVGTAILGRRHQLR